MSPQQVSALCESFYAEFTVLSTLLAGPGAQHCAGRFRDLAAPSPSTHRRVGKEKISLGQVFYFWRKVGWQAKKHRKHAKTRPFAVPLDK